MVERLKDWVRDTLRVPPEPEPPFGAPGSVRIFRAGRGYFYYRMIEWGLKQLGALAGILFLLTWVASDNGAGFIDGMNQAFDRPIGSWPFDWPLTVMDLWILGEMLAVAGFVLQMPFTFLMVFLDFEYRWYITTDRSLRVREGLVRVEERTMTFSNIQNVSVRQGPLQRFLGISDLEVSTAGGGGSSSDDDKKGSGGKNLHRAYFRGIDNAVEVRDTILRHLRSLRASGLGDPDEDHEETVPATSDGTDEDLLAAARGMLQETRALRRAMG